MAEPSTSDADKKPGEAAPGLRALKQLWNIPTRSGKKRPEAPKDVVTDIYHVPARKNGVPPRSHGRS